MHDRKPLPTANELLLTRLMNYTLFRPYAVSRVEFVLSIFRTQWVPLRYDIGEEVSENHNNVEFSYTQILTQSEPPPVVVCS